MANVVNALFKDATTAAQAVTELKKAGFEDQISIVAKGEQSEAVTQQAGESGVSEGATSGAVSGGVIGGLAGLLTGVATFVIPGVGLVVLGPLVSTLTGLVGGAATGGLLGALVDMGMSEGKAKEVESAVKQGQVLVSVSTSDTAAKDILTKSGGQLL